MSPSSSSKDLPFPESSFVTVDGIRLHVRTWRPRSGRLQGAALLLHGFAGSTFSWRFVGPGLSENGHLTVAADLPGFGYSEREAASEMNDLRWTSLMWQLVEQIESDVLKLDPHFNSTWILIGHSVGSRVAAAMVSQWPERVRAVVLIDAALYGSPADLSLLGLSPLRWLMGNWFRNHLLTRKGVESMLRKAYGRVPQPHEIDGYLHPLEIPQTLPVLMNIGAALPEVTRADLQRIHRPVLIVWGEKDAWIDSRNALRIFNDLPDAQVYIIPGAGHLPMETNPADVLERILQFLRKP